MPGISQDMPGIYFALLLTQCVNSSVLPVHVGIRRAIFVVDVLSNAYNIG
jgi:hypothetical protein